MTKKSSGGSGNRKDLTRPYEVGYGRPPVHGRFKPGQSGNPKGRPKRKRNLRTEIREELDKPIALREGDRTRMVTKQNAIIAMLINATMKGDQKACNSLLSIMRAVGLADEAPETNPNEPLTANHAEIIAAFVKRKSSRGSGEPSGGGDQP
jgi:hypothetical protein